MACRVLMRVWGRWNSPALLGGVSMGVEDYETDFQNFNYHQHDLRFLDDLPIGSWMDRS